MKAMLFLLLLAATAALSGRQGYYRGWHEGFCTRSIDSGQSLKVCEDVKL